MSRNSNIEWCDDTVNFWWGCTKVSEACQFCYAESLDKRRGPFFDNGHLHWGPSAPRWVRTAAAMKEARASSALAAKEGRRRRIFVNSMSDTFEDHPALVEARAAALPFLATLTDVDILLLTKRPENVRAMVPPEWLWPGKWPKHIWFGTTAENQARLNQRWAHLMHVPAAVIFLSIEPMLGTLNLKRVVVEAPGAGGTCFLDITAGTGCSLGGSWATRKVSWVIIGGESGQSPRDFDAEAAWDLLIQCRSGGVAPFVKQLGARPVTDNANALDWPIDTVFIEHGDGAASARVKLVDSKGGDIDEFPEELRVRQFPEVAA